MKRSSGGRKKVQTVCVSFSNQKIGVEGLPRRGIFVGKTPLSCQYAGDFLARSCFGTLFFARIWPKRQAKFLWLHKTAVIHFTRTDASCKRFLWFVLLTLHVEGLSHMKLSALLESVAYVQGRWQAFKDVQWHVQAFENAFKLYTQLLARVACIQGRWQASFTINFLQASKCWRLLVWSFALLLHDMGFQGSPSERPALLAVIFQGWFIIVCRWNQIFIDSLLLILSVDWFCLLESEPWKLFEPLFSTCCRGVQV